MDVEVILHDSGELLPILLDDDGMPIPLPNEFILSKRKASANTLIRNLRGIKLLYEWFYIQNIDLYERLIQKKPFTEAEITGSPIRPISSEVADALENYSEKNVEINQDILSKINDLKPLKLEEAILCLNAISLNKINFKVLIRWISQCGKVEDENKFNKDLLTLVLKSFVFKDKKNVNEFEEEFSKFLDSKKSKFRSIHPFYIITLCNNLFEFKKQQFLNTYRLLEKVISKKSFQSRVYLYYLYSLMNLEKYETLKSHLEKIYSNNINPEFLILRARYYSVIGDYENAKNDYIKITESYKESLNIWSDYLLLSLKFENVGQTKKILDDIPEKILTPRAKNIFRFIYLVYTEIDSVYAEKLITKLFLMEPNFVAPYLCNMHLTLIANKKELVSCH